MGVDRRRANIPQDALRLQRDDYRLPMRIGIDGLALNQQLTGVGYYTLELARALAQNAPHDDFKIISPRPYVVETSRDGCPPNLSFKHVPANVVTRRWWTIGASRYLAANLVDLFHG